MISLSVSSIYYGIYFTLMSIILKIIIKLIELILKELPHYDWKTIDIGKHPLNISKLILIDHPEKFIIQMLKQGQYVG